MKIVRARKKQDPVKSAIYNPKEFRGEKAHAWPTAQIPKEDKKTFKWALILISLIFVASEWYFGEGYITKKAMPTPDSGEIQRNTSESPNTIYAPLRLMATSSAWNYVVKLEKWENGDAVLTAFVRRGEVVDVKVPIGVYRAKYAYGNVWYGPHELFGKETVVANVVPPLMFTLEPTRIRGQLINLAPTPAGNLRVTKGEKANF